MENPQEKFMQRAIALALENVKNGGGPFGCVVVKNGEIISEGANRVTSQNDPTAHAEIAAIRQACEKLGSFQLEDCEVYTSCEPCPMCLGALYWARPKVVFFAQTRKEAADMGFDDELIYTEIGLEPGVRKIPFRHLPQPNNQLLAQAWKDFEGRMDY